ncbi:beta-D-xylosidase [Musa troglodytarum]|uniref:Beta-D-xylosidase n=1 Tax=Musa troglodytarum TaxID=320322 RepID=A0A9E7FCB7_9LILI|nr:beta-D-xylosidase [Musa troglodytarum]
MGTRGLIFSSALLLLLAQPLLVFSATPPFACDPANPSTQNFGFCQTTLPIDKRVSDLISRLTLEEKIQQLDDQAPEIPRLGVPKYNWWSEALHGLSNGGHGMHFIGRTIPAATSFPQVILTAASFNPDLWYRIGQAIAVEARALYNAGQADGLTLWSPNVNIYRDPRWGRGQETPGEDPTTASKYAVAFVRGLQGDSPTGERSGQLMASACCKHLTAYDLDDWNGNVRYTFDAQVTAQDMEDTFQPPFRSCVEQGRATCVMCSYNRVNGVPTCADYNLLTKQAKNLWGLDGYISSDCGSVDMIYGSSHYAKTPEEAVGYALKAGVDINCGKFMHLHAGSAIQKGNICESDIDRALFNAFSLRMKLGLFNGNPQQLPSGNIPPCQVCSTKHKNLALQAAQDGIVLLKNTGNTLPLARYKVTSLGVIGPNANFPPSLMGNYNGPPCEVITPLAALQSSIKNTRFEAGCNIVACNVTRIPEAVQLASSVDYVIMFMGLDQDQEREGLDRTDLVLPGMQQALISNVAEAAKKPIILVLLSGGPLDITFAENDPRIGAILWAGYPGEAGGSAISSIIFGEHNPGGKLPVTWYPQDFTKVPMSDMRMRANPPRGYPGRTYRFYTGNPVYQFGYGLSYSYYSYEFEAGAATSIYLNNSLSPQAQRNDPNTLSYDIASLGFNTCGELKISATVGVKNHGPMAGRHPALLFSRWPSTEHGRPVKQLVGFQSVHLEAGESTKVEFSLSACEHLSRVMDDGRRVLDKGSHFLIVGDREHEISIIA